MLSKTNRLEAKSFRYTYQKGIKIRGLYGMLVILNNNTPTPSKFGFVVSKKIGNAVTRNRMTRMLRAISYEAIKELELENKGYSFEYIAFKFAEDYNKLKKEFFEQIEKGM